MRISVVGLGYVGLSLAFLLAKTNEVYGMDIDKKRILDIKTKGAKIFENHEIFIDNSCEINLNISVLEIGLLAKSECIIVATSTDYSEETGRLNTSSVDEVVNLSQSVNPSALIVIKSTVPIGFTDSLRKKYNTKNIIFSPEFLREGYELCDNVLPSRIIVGDIEASQKWFSELLLEISENKHVSIMHTSSCEAEAIKLFSNSFLAMRVAFFNELDTFSECYHLNAKTIIEGIGMDKRIGDYYNNPSFGFGGYCLPKDVKQLEFQLQNTPVSLIPSINLSNKLRQNYITEQILSKNYKIIGIYGIGMKSGSDNSRSAAIIPIIKKLVEHNKTVEIFSQDKDRQFIESLGARLETNLDYFKSHVDVIVANRYDKSLEDVNTKLFSRDIFHVN